MSKNPPKIVLQPGALNFANVAPAKLEQLTVHKDVYNAMTEAQTMSEAISALLPDLIGVSDQTTFPLLMAIEACLQRLDRAINPMMDRCMPERE